MLRKLAYECTDPAFYGLKNSDWAQRCGMRERSLLRQVLQETGCSFKVWRQHIRFLPTLTYLSEGRSGEEVASLAGYKTTPAFISVFDQIFGETPGRFRESLESRNDE